MASSSASTAVGMGVRKRAYKAGFVVHSLDAATLELLVPGEVRLDHHGKVEYCRVAAGGKRLIATPDGVSESEGEAYVGLEDSDDVDVEDLGDGTMLMPGFVDLHAHAPQYKFAGSGNDLPLLDWLKTYTFPTEAKFSDSQYARGVYEKAVRRHLLFGSTTVVYFASMHVEATVVLADVVEKYGQRAFVGKVCMDRNSEPYYIESEEESVRGTLEVAENIIARNNPLITPIITPRFVPTCSAGLMRKLADIAAKLDIPVQSHLCENKNEIAWVRDLHPEEDTYTGVYDRYGLLNARACVMAHGVHLTPDERHMLAQRGTGIAHCPISNFNLRSGVCDVKQLMRDGVKVGLGSDVAGGHHPSMLEVMRAAIAAANVLTFDQPQVVKPPMSIPEVFYLATLGGARVMGIDDTVGNFAVGKQFDALVVDIGRHDKGPFDVFDDDSHFDILSKFIHLGDDRSIKRAYVAGKQVVPMQQL